MRPDCLSFDLQHWSLQLSEVSFTVVTLFNHAGWAQQFGSHLSQDNKAYLIISQRQLRDDFTASVCINVHSSGLYSSKVGYLKKFRIVYHSTEMKLFISQRRFCIIFCSRYGWNMDLFWSTKMWWTMKWNTVCLNRPPRSELSDPLWSLSQLCKCLNISAQCAERACATHIQIDLYHLTHSLPGGEPLCYINSLGCSLPHVSGSGYASRCDTGIQTRSSWDVRLLLVFTAQRYFEATEGALLVREPPIKVH